MTMPTASQIIARRLHDAGCRHAFGIPGGEIMVMMDALEQAGIRMHLTRHENCAGFMAEGVHHFDNAPAILVTTIGPGIANAVNVIANACQDRVPMIVFTGCVTGLHRHTYTHQVFDHVNLLGEVTKAAFRAGHDNAAVIADKALAMALEGRPGPVLIDMPVDIQAMQQQDSWPSHQPVAPSGPASSEYLHKAQKWFSEARRPLVIAGVDVLNQNASAAVAGFCRRYAIPLITTYKAKGVLPETDELSLGGAGLSPGADNILVPLVRQSDCLILAGYDPIEMRIGWQNVWGPQDRVIEFSAVANTHFMHQSALNFIGDVAAGLAALAANGGPEQSWPGGQIAAARAQLADRLQLNEDWGPAAVIDECRKVLPENTIASVDSGAHRILLSQIWQCHEPRGLIQSTALCTMGVAVPVALGRKIAEPDRPVVAFTGDAGLEMFLGELATIRDCRLCLPVVVFVDESLGLIELKQRGLQLPSLAVDFGGSDFPAIARALGGYGEWCDSRADIRRAMAGALNRNTFTLLAARIGKRAYEGRL